MHPPVTEALASWECCFICAIPVLMISIFLFGCDHIERIIDATLWLRFLGFHCF